jgi:HAD superfamily hydrolase (TIGR01450 family)
MTSLPTGALLAASDPPCAVHDVALLDLDGVIYVGDDPVPHAADALDAAVRAGMRLAFVTNNALRTPEQVAAKLGRAGVRASPHDIVTSAQAAARIVLDRCGTGARVLVAGGQGLREALAAVGLTAVGSADDAPDAVAVGYDPTIDYSRLAEAGLAARRGAVFVVCNRDATIPSSRGPMAGMGAIAAFVTVAAGTDPVVAGKPETALHAESVRRSGAHAPLVVGDRLDTDIEGARRADTPSLLVLTGVTDLTALCQAAQQHRPTQLSPDLRGLLEAHPAADAGRCREAAAEVRDGRLELVAGSGPDLIRAAVTACWAAADAGHPAKDLAVLEALA